MTANFDKTDILRTWQTFRQPGEVLELRIPKAGKLKTISGYYNDPARLADSVIGLAEEKFAGIYFTINPVRQELLARASNRYVKYAETTTSDADITALHWLPVDLDAKRPAGISSTDGEHEAAISKAKEIRRWLIEEQHWPAGAFVLADSGNGGHLNVKIDLPNLPENVTLVRSCLDVLDFLFTDDKIAVDTTFQNPARIWKLYGTMARKGDSTVERPHRLSRLLDVPETPETVTKAQLEALSAMLPEQDGVTEDTYTTGGKGFDPVAYCKVHNLQVHHTKSFMGGTLAVLEKCIFDSSHAQTACIIGWPNGARTYRCRHHSCLDKHWKDARAVIEPDTSSGTEDHLNPDEISEEELNAYSLPEGPKFECQLPKDHFLQRYMAYGFDVSDAYSDYWFAGGLVALSVVADKKLKMVLRQGVQYTNIYAAIIGKSGLGRKTTIVDKTENMICKVLPQLLPALVPTEFSPEAFTEHMSDYNHAPWIRDEAAGVLSLMKKDYMRGFKDSLMQLYDCRPFFRKLRTSQRKNAKTEFRVDDPYLNLFFATTDASLGANTEQNDTLSGFLARFLFFFPQGKKTKWMPLEEGTAQNSIFEEVVRSQLSGIAAKMGELQECTAMHFSPEAASYYTEWQRVTEAKWIASNDGFYMQIYSRLAPTVAKFVMLFELGSPDFDVSSPIRLEFMQEACRLVDSYFMPTARAIYDLIGANAEKNVIDKITAYLKNHNGKATKNEIMRNIKIKSKDFSEYLSTMIESGIVDTKIVKRGGKGRDTLYVFLVDQPKVGNVTNVDNVAIIANVEEIHPGNIEADLSTLATKATSHIVATNDGNDKSDAVEEQGADVDEGEEEAASSFACEDEPTPTPTNKESEDPGFQKFKAGMAKRLCCLCGRKFPYDLTPYFNEGKSGYICVTCHMEGPPPAPVNPDSQTTLGKDEVPA